MPRIALIAVLLFSATVHAGEPFQAVFVEAEDGDTLVVLLDDRLLTIHIAAVDAPEMGQAFGEEAAVFLAEAAASGEMVVTPIERNTSGEVTAKVSVGGADLGAALIEAGMAWYDLDDGNEKMVIKQMIARSSKRGLWSDPEPVEPSRWRAAQAVQPTPTPPPRTLGEIATQVELVKDEDGRAVIEQPAQHVSDSSGTEMTSHEDESGATSAQCCCRIYLVEEGQERSNIPVYRFIDINVCRSGKWIEYPEEGRYEVPNVCSHESLCQ